MLQALTNPTKNHLSLTMTSPSRRPRVMIRTRSGIAAATTVLLTWLLSVSVILLTITIPVTQARIRGMAVPSFHIIDNIVKDNKEHHHDADNVQDRLPAQEDEAGAHANEEGTWLSWRSSSSWNDDDDDDNNRYETTFLQGAEALLQTGGNVHIIVHCTEELDRVKEVMLQEGISMSSVSFHIQKPSPGYDGAHDKN
jgi:hypothetical protein